MANKLKNVVVNEVSLVKRGANGKRIFLTKSADDTEGSQMSDEKSPEVVALEKAQADAAAAQARIVELEKAAAEATEKAAADAKASAERAEALEKAQADAVAKAAELEKALAVEKEAKELADSIQKAAADFKNLPEKAEDLGPLLRSVRKADSALGDRLEGLLKKLDALAKDALEPRGTAKAPEKSESAWAEIEKRANALVTAKAVQTFAAGVEKVLHDDKDLYAQHTAEAAAR